MDYVYIYIYVTHRTTFSCKLFVYPSGARAPRREKPVLKLRARFAPRLLFLIPQQAARIPVPRAVDSYTSSVSLTRSGMLGPFIGTARLVSTCPEFLPGILKRNEKRSFRSLRMIDTILLDIYNQSTSISCYLKMFTYLPFVK